MSERQLLSTGEAAALLGISAERVRQLAVDGTLPTALRTSLGRVFRRADVMTLQHQRADAARSPKPKGAKP